PWFLDFGGVLSRHPIILTLAFLLCGGIGYYFGSKYKVNLYTIEGRERFAKTPLPEGVKSAYDPMSLSAYADLFQSEELLRPVASEFISQLPKDNPIRFLQKEIKVDTPRMIDIIELKFDAADPEFGKRLIDRLMERHIEYTNNMRRNSVLRSAGESMRYKIA